MKPDDLELVAGSYRIAQALFVVTELGVADELSAGPKTTREIAASVGADPGVLGRILWTLSGEDVFSRDRDGRYSLTAVGDRLRSDVPGGARGKIIGWSCLPSVYAAFGALSTAARTGANGFEAANGKKFYDYLATGPRQAAAFHAAMAEQPEAYLPFIDAYDFASFRRVVDVGGAQGGFLAMLLRRYPGIEGVLFDLPGVVAAAPEFLRTYGVDDRVEVVGGDMFETMPAGADVYVFSTVLRCFEDDDCVTVLRQCREAMAGEGRILAIEMVLPPSAQPDTTAGLRDLTAMIVYGGRDRSIQHWHELLAGAGLSLANSAQVDGPYFLLEASAA